MAILVLAARSLSVSGWLVADLDTAASCSAWCCKHAAVAAGRAGDWNLVDALNRSGAVALDGVATATGTGHDRA